ncbi:MAG: hypothetical protein ACI87O_002219 [Planctomycetota bacterium]|jgi:hypothetical protein
MSDEKNKTRELYEELVATQPEFRIKGRATAYTSLNGHMFSFMTKEGGLVMRLGQEQQEVFVKKHRSGPVIQNNATMRGYVHVPDSLLQRTAEAAKWFQASVDHIRSLEPRATGKPKTKAGSKKKSAEKKAAKKLATKDKSAKKKAAQKKAGKKRMGKQASVKRAAAKEMKATTTKAASSKKGSTKKALTKKTGSKKAPAPTKKSATPTKAAKKPKAVKKKATKKKATKKAAKK